ncbi:FecR domain-containing protein [Rapidithrix thailandica]|uniref:FecR domain-containing protein n=1 Tax=Rapidithrix thailandica TaxID=413964 RepID=A0AAW9S8B2_9BACT
MNDQDYTVEELITNDSFLKWVRQPDEETSRYWEAWQNQAPVRMEAVRQARQLLTNLHFFNGTLSTAKKEALWQNIQQQKPNFRPVHQVTTSKGRHWLPIVSGMAAVLVLLWMARINFFTSDTPDKTDSKPELVLIEKYNPKGQKTTLRLSDGSVIKLNADSKLVYPKHFAHDKREVTLEGEAFFEISKDAQRPFIVKAGKLKTRVLGTSFNIYAYPEAAEVNIALVSGKVEVQSEEVSLIKEDKVTMAPGEMFTYNRFHNKVEKRAFDPKEVLAWREGLIIFKKANLTEITWKLERWYGLEFKKIGPVAENQNYTGQFHHEALENVLKGISYSTDLQFEIQNNNVYIRQK